MPGTALGAHDTAVNKTDKAHVLTEITLSGQEKQKRDRICQAVINALKTMKQWEAVESDRVFR